MHLFWILFSAEHMQKEIDTVLGQHGVPQMEHRKSLNFTDAVIHEVQRYMDFVPLSVPHYATKNISFRGYVIPKVGQLLSGTPNLFLIILCYCIIIKMLLCKP